MKDESKLRKLIDIDKLDLKSIRLKAFSKGISIKQYIETLVSEDSKK